MVAIEQRRQPGDGRPFKPLLVGFRQPRLAIVPALSAYA